LGIELQLTRTKGLSLRRPRSRVPARLPAAEVDGDSATNVSVRKNFTGYPRFASLRVQRVGVIP
jgi:hypothetical protein